MKMLKKLLAVVLTGAMALTLFTACGGNAVTDKDLADALNDMAKVQAQANGQDTYITFTPQAKEREMARKFAALQESGAMTDDKAKEILGCKEGGPNASNFVWLGAVIVDGIGIGGQVYQFVENDVLDTDGEYAYHSQKDKTPANDRHMGTALCKMSDDDGNLVTWRVIVVTAKAVDES